jgi:hypothetical protein
LAVEEDEGRHAGKRGQVAKGDSIQNAHARVTVIRV